MDRYVLDRYIITQPTKSSETSNYINPTANFSTNAPPTLSSLLASLSQIIRNSSATLFLRRKTAKHRSHDSNILRIYIHPIRTLREYVDSRRSIIVAINTCQTHPTSSDDDENHDANKMPGRKPQLKSSNAFPRLSRVEISSMYTASVGSSSSTELPS